LGFLGWVGWATNGRQLVGGVGFGGGFWVGGLTKFGIQIFNIG